MGLTACGNDVPLVASCPADTEQVLFFNVAGQPTGMALRSWARVKCCAIQQIFGTGVITFTGADLDSEGRYYNSSLINNLLVFAENIPNFINRDSQWDYILDDGNVIGVEIKIGYLDDDIFIIFPNPQTNC